VHEGQVIRRSLFIAGGHPPELLQPVDAALRPTPLPIHLPVEPRRSTALAAFGPPLLPLVFPLRDDVPEPAATQHSAALRIAVALVQRHLVRPLPRPTARPGHANASEHRLQLRTFVPLARRQADRQRPPAPVGGEVQLGAEPAATATERLVGRRDFPLFPRPPAARSAPAAGAPRPRADAPGPSSRRSRPPSKRLPQRLRRRPGGPGGPVPRRLGGASAGAGRGRSSTSRTAPACRAREHRCAAPTGSR
jgi:hypothetical protein